MKDLVNPKPPASDELLYHYTSIDAFLGIVDSREMWASHIRYLNDTSEQCLIWDLITARVDQRLKTARGSERNGLLKLQSDSRSPLNSDVYVICFSKDDGDRLSQWRGYGGTGGVSIGFNGDELKQRTSAFLTVQTPGALKWWCILQEVGYLEATLNDRTAATIDYFLDTVVIPTPSDTSLSQEQILHRSVSIWSPQFKNRAFEEEHEWRVSIADLAGDNSAVSFRTKRSMLVPYLTFDLGKSVWPMISRIVVGPSSNQLETLVAIKMRIDDDRVLVEPSNIPYRDW